MSLSKHRDSGRKSDRHDLFISFRGSDTRTQIIDHLINYFRNNKINAFFDRTKIMAGENIRKALRQAIDKSTMYVVVFSDNYSESKYCLWELEAIVEAAEKANGKQILAVFYGVTRDDVSLETNLYTEKLSKIEAAESTVQVWKKALQYAAKVNQGLIATPNAENDARLCQQILERVQQMIGPKEPSVHHLKVDLRGLPNFVSTKSSELLLAASNSLCIEDCNTLDSSLFTLPGQKELEQLRVSRCRTVVEIPCLGELSRLKVLIIKDCMSLKSLPNLSKLKKLEVLHISFCPSLKEILGLSWLESLYKLEISNCDNLRRVDIHLRKLEKLEELLIENCRNLRILGSDDISQNMQSPSQNPNINWDDDHDNIQLPAETSVSPVTQSGFVVETDHHAAFAFGRSRHNSVSYTGSSSTTVNTTNEQETIKERRFDESGTNSMVASRPVMLYHSWYPDPETTNHLTNNTSPIVDSDLYHDTGTMVLDHQECATISNDDFRDNSLEQLEFSGFYKTSPDEHTKEQQETSEELLNAWILIDKEEAALDVLRHFFSSGIQMGAADSANDTNTITAVAEAVQILLSENVTSKGDAWKSFSINVRFAYFDCMIGHQQPMTMSAKIEADHVTLLKAIKNELQAKDFERAACISDQWLLLLKQHWDHLLAATYL